MKIKNQIALRKTLQPQRKGLQNLDHTISLSTPNHYLL